MLILLALLGIGVAAYALTRGPSTAPEPAAQPLPVVSPAAPTSQPSKPAAPFSRPSVPAPSVAVPLKPALVPSKAESPKPSPGSLAKPAAPLVLPRYPVGLEAKFNGKKAVVKQAWQDGQGGWHFKLDIDAGMPFGIGNMTDKAVSEQFLRDTLANQLKQPLAPDQAFPAGVEIYRKGKGGLIQSASKNSEGLWLYTLNGWGAPVTQGKLLDELVKA